MTAASLKSSLSGRLLNPTAIEFVPSFSYERSPSSQSAAALPDAVADSAPDASSLLDASIPAQAHASAADRNDERAGSESIGQANGHAGAECDSDADVSVTSRGKPALTPAAVPAEPADAALDALERLREEGLFDQF